MRTAYVIHAPQDLDFVRSTLIRPLPIAGIERWLSAQHLRAAGSALSPAAAMAASDVVLVALSRLALASPDVRAELESALAHRHRVVPIWMEEPGTVADPVKSLMELPGIDLRTKSAASPLDRIRRELGDLLPAAAPARA